MAPSRLVCPPSLPFLLLALGAVGCAVQDYDFAVPGQGDDTTWIEQAAMEHLRANQDRYGVRDVDDFAPLRIFRGELGMGHAHVQQAVDGVPVFEGQAIVHLTADGRFAGITNDLHADIEVDTTPTMGADQAIGTAVGHWGSWDALTRDPTASLTILRRDHGDHLAWQVQLHAVDGSDASAMPVIFVDAHDGSVLRQFDNLRNGTATGTATTTYEGEVELTVWESGGRYLLEDAVHGVGTYTLGGSSPRNGSQYASQSTLPEDDDNRWTDAADQAAIDAHYAASNTLAWYAERYGRDGVDGSGGPGDHSSVSGSGELISVYVNYGNNSTQAFWDGERVTLGDGDGRNLGLMTAVELVAHELTHGVTQHTANLTYQDESGALNEAVSDIMGAGVEVWLDGGVSSGTWLIGEDLYTPGTAGDAFRYFDDPSRDGQSPNHYDDLYRGNQDNGGVHTNSGVPNLAFHLMAAGGSHPSRASQEVVGMGIEPALDVWYRGLTTYMTTRTDMAAARTALIQAAEDLYGEDSLELLAVGDAWAAVGVGDYLTGEDEPEDTGEPPIEDTGEPPEDDPVDDEPGACAGYHDLYTGSLARTGDAAWEPAGSFYQAAPGVHRGCLEGPADADLDLYLYIWNGRSWVAVAGSRERDSFEQVQYSGPAGYYSWLVHSHEGGGTYEIGLTLP